MACPVCKQRKAKRLCPAQGETICSICCGREREVTIGCPLTCTYLRDGRLREPRHGHESEEVHKNIRVSWDFLEQHEELSEAVARALTAAALQTGGAVDSDVREALDALIQTQHTLAGGIYYETRPASAFARAVMEEAKVAIEDFRSQEEERLGFDRTSDDDLLKTLVFLARVAQDYDNQRPRGRAFLHLLAQQFNMEEQRRTYEIAGGLILPGR